MTNGDEALKRAIARRRIAARSEDPRPYDDTWGWWVEERIRKLETGQIWLIRIAIGALAAEIIRIICTALGIGP